MDVAQNARTQVLYREVNAQILAIQGSFGEPLSVQLMCECGQECSDKVMIDADSYMRVRSDATHFLVAAGHHVPEVDHMVEDHGSWLLVEAFGVAAEIARKGLAD
jgi:hypothetical protein